MAIPVALMVALQAIVAIGQVAVQGPVGLGWLGEIALDPAAPGIGIVESEAGVRLLRGYGLSDHPNILGGLLAAGVIVIAGGLRVRPGWPGRTGAPAGSSRSRPAWASSALP